MPKAAEDNAEKLSAPVARIQAGVYAWGRAEAMNELLNFLTAGGGQTTGGKAGHDAGVGKPASPGRLGGGRSARQGSVSRFVVGVLLACSGSTAREIAGRAADASEPSIGLSPIRVELRKGRASGGYASDGGRWSLAAPTPPPEGGRNRALGSGVWRGRSHGRCPGCGERSRRSRTEGGTAGPRPQSVGPPGRGSRSATHAGGNREIQWRGSPS